MLLVVLWVMGLVSVAAGALTVWSGHELRLGHVPLESVQQQAIAEAGIQQAMALLNSDDAAVDHLAEPWATGEQNGEQQLRDIMVGSGTFSVGMMSDTGFQPGLVDEERKLNLNSAAQGALERLIALIGASGSRPAAEIAAAIVDWRDEPVGAWCDEGQLGYPCHNGPFDSVDELRLVPGVTPQLFLALAPYVTVYGSGMVNVNTASVTVLNALGYPGDTLVEQRSAQPFLVSPYPSDPQLAVTSSAFTATVEASLPQSAQHVRLSAVVDRAGCGAAPPVGARCVLAWLPQ